MTTLLTSAADAAPAGGTDRITATIHAALQAQADAWKRGDAEGFCADFLPDVHFINVRGDSVRGRDAVAKIHAFIFAGPYRNTCLDTQIDNITYAVPTVAIVDCTMAVTGFATLPPGLVPTEPGTLRTRMKFIFVERDGEWKILSGQNTAISPARIDPK